MKFVEFAVVPDANGEAPRMMHLVDEPGTRSIFVSTMRGALYSVSYEGKRVIEYLDINAQSWNIGVQFQGSERGFQSFAFHPQFGQRGTRGFGKFYTYTDTTDITPKPDFTHPAPTRTHDTVSRRVDLTGPRSEAGLTWPIAEFDHTDPLFTRSAITGVYVYREKEIKQLQNLLLFGDNPSGEIFYLNADKLPSGGQDQIRRIMFDDKGTNKTLLQLIREKNATQSRPPAARADLRFGCGPRGQIFILNKRDGVIRLFVP